jgi:hypothetical protein
MSTNSQAMQLRYLTTLQTIATDKSSTVIFPFPMDMLNLLPHGGGRSGGGGGGGT